MSGPRLVAENDDAALTMQRRRAEADRAKEWLAQRTRDLAANMLRVIAGAGKSFELMDQMEQVAQAYVRLVEHLDGIGGDFAYGATLAMEQALRDLDWRSHTEGYGEGITDADRARWRDDGSTALAYTESVIFSQALRVVAAQLARQPTQESRAGSSFAAALRWREEARAEHIKRVDRAARGLPMVTSPDAPADPRLYRAGDPTPAIGSPAWSDWHLNYATEQERAEQSRQWNEAWKRQEAERKAALAALEGQFPRGARVRLVSDGEGRGWSAVKRAAARAGALGTVIGYRVSSGKVRVGWDGGTTHVGSMCQYLPDEIVLTDVGGAK